MVFCRRLRIKSAKVMNADWCGDPSLTSRAEIVYETGTGRAGPSAKTGRPRCRNQEILAMITAIVRYRASRLDQARRLPRAFPQDRARLRRRQRADRASNSSGPRTASRAASINGTRSRTRALSIPGRGSTASSSATAIIRRSNISRPSRSATRMTGEVNYTEPKAASKAAA